MKKRKHLTGPPCPTGGEEHGGMYDLEPGVWYCPHASHHGVVYPENEDGDMSRFIFTDKEATEAQEAYWNGSH